MKSIIVSVLLVTASILHAQSPSPAQGAGAAAPETSPEKARALEIRDQLIAAMQNDDASPETWIKIDKEIQGYPAEFKKSPASLQNVVLLRNFQMQVGRQYPDRSRYLALVKSLLTDPQPEVAAMAKAEQEKIDNMAALMKKPFDLKFTAVDGQTVDLAKMRGKVVLIDFWATWCPPCREEVPNVVATYQKYHDQGFEIVGISLDKSKEALLSFTKENGMTWPQYFDGKQWKNEISTQYGIDSVPTMWLIDKKGMLVSTEARNDLAGQVEKLLK